MAGPESYVSYNLPLQALSPPSHPLHIPLLLNLPPLLLRFKLIYNRPGAAGPSYAPPPHPEGWIAQWDPASAKYYFVQLSTGTSQWDIPTHAAPVGATPVGSEHPFGTPGSQANQLKMEDGDAQGTRGMGGNGQDGERGMGMDLGVCSPLI